MKTWYAIYTKARSEKKVAALLARDEIEHYLPLIKRVKIWSDRKKQVEEPLFSSYVFVCIDEKEHLKVLQVYGVVRYISFEGKKVSIRAAEIEAIRRYAETGEEFLMNESDFKIGKKVKVVVGPMKGLEGKLIEVLGKQRVKVEIEAVGKAIFIRIPKGSLEIVGSYKENNADTFW